MKIILSYLLGILGLIVLLVWLFALMGYFGLNARILAYAEYFATILFAIVKIIRLALD